MNSLSYCECCLLLRKSNLTGQNHSGQMCFSQQQLDLIKQFTSMRNIRPGMFTRGPWPCKAGYLLPHQGRFKKGGLCSTTAHCMKIIPGLKGLVKAIIEIIMPLSQLTGLYDLLAEFSLKYVTSRDKVNGISVHQERGKQSVFWGDSWVQMRSIFDLSSSRIRQRGI